MGRPKKPTKLKLLTGNPGKRPLPKNEIEPTVAENCQYPGWWNQNYETPEAEHIFTESKIFFDEIKPKLIDLGLLTEVDEIQFQQLAYYYGLWQFAQKKLLSEGFTVFSTNKNGHEYETPSVFLRVQKEAFDSMMKIAVRFGLNPSSRAGLVGKKSEADSSFSDLIARGRSLPGRK